MSGKLGKKPFTPSPKDFKLKSFALAFPQAPTSKFGFGTLYTNWGMLGNDQYGDCVFAGADHETMLWNKLAKHETSFTASNALADYSVVTGFDIHNPDTDQGAVVRDVMNYRRTTGMADSKGVRHKIDAFVSIDAGNWDLMLACVFIFGVVGIGFDFPESASDQFNDGKPWDVVSGSTIEGGHYVPIVGSMAPATEATCITWGQRQRLTKAFYQKYNDEAWVPLTRESLLPATNVRHINWDELNTDLNAL